jgi:Dolichyl-phosphate-mannose-protein mannosyltransferase
VLRQTSTIAKFFFLASISVVLLGTGVLYTGLPGSPDQIELDYLAWLVLDGGIPYVDFVDNNWPGGYMLHMVSTFLFGNTLHSWRVLDYLIMAAGLACLVDLLRRAFGAASACWAAVLYPGLYAASFSFWFAGQRDATIANLFWIVIWCYWLAWNRKKPSWQIFAGSIIAVATLLKPTAIFIVPLISLHIVWCSAREERRSRKEALSHIFWAAIACGTVLMTAFGMVLLEGTSLQALLDSVWFFNWYSQNDPSITINGILWKALRVHFESWHWISAGVVLSVTWLFFLSKEKKFEVIFLFAVVYLAGWVSFVFQGRGFIYHLGIVYSGMLPFLFIGLGKLVEELLQNYSITKRTFAFVGILIAIFGSVKKNCNMFSDSYAWRSGRLQTEQYYDKYAAGDGMSLGDVHRLIPLLEKSVPMGETLLMLGTQSATNYLLERRQPTRFYYFPIFLEAREPLELVERWNEVFQNEVVQIHSPIALIDRSSLLEQPKSKNYITENSLLFLRTNLNENYEKIGEYKSVDLYRRR